MPHGYYNLNGDFIETDTKEEATAAWREERGYDPVGVFDVGDGEIIDTRGEEPDQTPATATQLSAAAGGGGGLPPVVPPLVPNAPIDTPQPTYDVQGIQSIGTATPADQGYDVQSIQGTPAPAQGISFATPTEQAAAQGGGVPTHIDPYFADLSAGMQYLYSRWPYNVGGEGTPTELRAGGGYSPSSFQWSESPASLNELAQGRTPVGPALAAADSVETFLIEFGVRPEFVTPFVAQSLGLSPTDMARMGYVQDLYGRWISLEFGEDTGDSAGFGGGYVFGGGGGGYGGGGYGGGFRSGYTSGLITWRIGL